jgi:acetylornithine deacetylase/succinyl-diaminopimelate desuccinylase-like protein
MTRAAIHDKLIATVQANRKDLVDLCLDLGNTPDVHGKVRPIADKVVAWFKGNGIDAYVQPITEESANAIAVLPGEGGGPSLIFNAHMDAGGPPSPDMAESEFKMRGAWVEGELLFGKGLINDKAQLCAGMIAARAIKKAGIRLKGDLIITGVDFETGEASVNERQGINFPGEGFGTKWLIDRGVVADYALVGETSEFAIVAAECGDVRFKIQVKGRRVYTPRLDRGSTLQENPNAYVRAAHVILALEEWAVAYERRERREVPGGVMIPKAQFLGLSSTEDNAYLYLDVRTAPGTNPVDIKREVEQVVKRLDLPVEVTIYQFNRGYVAKGAELLIESIKRAHRAVFAADPPPPPTADTSMWRDLNDFNEVGIPSVCYGPKRHRETMTNSQNRAMKIDDLVQCAKVYALTFVELCGQAQT